MLDGLNISCFSKKIDLYEASLWYFITALIKRCQFQGMDVSPPDICLVYLCRTRGENTQQILPRISTLYIENSPTEQRNNFLKGAQNREKV